MGHIVVDVDVDVDVDEDGNGATADKEEIKELCGDIFRRG